MEKLVLLFAKIGRLLDWLIWTPLEPGEVKRQLNIRNFYVLIGIIAVGFIVFALFVPSTPTYVGEFKEIVPPEQQKQMDEDREQALVKLTATTEKAFSIVKNTNSSGNGGRVGRSEPDRNTSMIINRPGVNSANQLPAGAKFTVRILEKLTVGDQGMPLIAEVVRGVFNDSGGGIKEGSRLFGMAQFQNGSDRAQIQFQSLADLSGIVRNIQSIALEADGQAGVAGDVHTKGLANAAGQFASRFIGAYAEGSQRRDFLGNSQGGVENGVLNAVGATARDRATNYAEDLKKENQWIEIPKNKEVTVILTQTFTFNEPGGSQ